MKIILVSSAVLCLTAMMAFGQIRVTSWNINYGADFEKIFKSLRVINADIYALQEVDLMTKRTGFKDVAGELASRLNYYFAWSKEFEELRQRRNKKEKAFTGQAILSKFPIVYVRKIIFASQLADWSPSIFHVRSWFQPRKGGRIVQYALIKTDNGDIVICNTHLESRVADKKLGLQMKEIVIAVNKIFPGKKYKLIMGDFNTRKTGRESSALKILIKSGYRSAVPFNKLASTKVGKISFLDWIFLSSKINLLESEVLETEGSDHYPVVADIKLGS